MARKGTRMNIRLSLYRLKRAASRCCQFIDNFNHYYFNRRNSFVDSVELAKLTLP